MSRPPRSCASGAAPRPNVPRPIGRIMHTYIYMYTYAYMYIDVDAYLSGVGPQAGHDASAFLSGTVPRLYVPRPIVCIIYTYLHVYTCIYRYRYRCIS